MIAGIFAQCELARHHLRGFPADFSVPTKCRRLPRIPWWVPPEKSPDRAIQIAALSGMPLKIAAKVDRTIKPIGRT